MVEKLGQRAARRKGMDRTRFKDDKPIWDRGRIFPPFHCGKIARCRTRAWQKKKEKKLDSCSLILC